jgi:hypothetical protein
MSPQLDQLTSQMHQRLALEAIIAIVVIVFAAVYLRRSFTIILGIAVLLGSLATIIGGVAILSNNVGLSGPPGSAARLKRFLTVSWAATSERGDGAAVCPDSVELVAHQPIDARRHMGRRMRHGVQRTAAESRPGAVPSPPAQSVIDGASPNFYPELVRHAYPGIPPERLLQVAAFTVSGLPGWQIVSTDAKALTLAAIHKGSLFSAEDEIKISVTQRSEVDLCSRSRTGESGAPYPFVILHGDFGANIGHIKEFYAALPPAINEAYRERELDLTAAQHGIRP